jgi:hypothetical protein
VTGNKPRPCPRVSKVYVFVLGVNNRGETKRTKNE